MKRKTYFDSIKVFFTLLVLFFFTGVKSQSAQIYLSNDIQVSPTAIEFDICIKSTDPNFREGFHYGNGQFKITFNTDIKTADAVITFEMLDKSFSQLSNSAQINDSIIQPGRFNYVVVEAKRPQYYDDASVIMPTGTRIIRMRMNCSAPFVTGSLANLALSVSRPYGSACSYVKPDNLVKNIIGNTLTVGNFLSNAPLKSTL
jgi:hypothetical protein